MILQVKVLSAAVLLGIGFWIGHSSGPEPLAAQQSKTAITPVSATAPVVDQSKRVVAYIYGNVPITREEFGEYLISLYGRERIDLYVNKRIIEMACAKKDIDVTAQEVDAAIEDDCKRINISKGDYIRTVLKQRYGKTIHEWRTEVIKPRLMLARLCKDQIVVNDEELKQMFENRYGMKAKIKIILWPPEQGEFARKMYGKLRGEGTPENPDAAWDSVATKQPDANLAGRAGEIEPIGRHSGAASAKVEEIAFGLKVGDVSPIIELAIGHLVVKRTGTVEPVKGADFEKLKKELYKEVVERKLEKEIPLLFAQMLKEANVMKFIGEPRLPPAELSSRPPEVK